MPAASGNQRIALTETQRAERKGNQMGKLDREYKTVEQTVKSGLKKGK